MAETHGKLGAVYTPAALIRAKTISFATSDDSINDSASGLVAAGFTKSMKIVVSGSANNNGSMTLAGSGIAAGKMVVTSNRTDENAGNLITIVSAAPGTLSAGFFNWNISWVADVAEATDFSDVGNRTFIPGLVSWTATAERNHHDDWNPDTNAGTTSQADWINKIKMMRFFVTYVAVPAGGTPAYYYEGLAIPTAANTTTPNDDIIKQSLTFQGIGALTLVTRTTAWD